MIRNLIANPFQPVDINGLIRSHKLDYRGREDGGLDFPPATSINPTQTELNVIADVNAERSRCLQNLAGHLRAVNSALAQLDAGMDIARMRQDTDRAIADFQAITFNVETNLNARQRHAAEVQAEYATFRTRHRLSRPVRIKRHRPWTWAWLIVATVIEAIANGIFFASGSDDGLLGGIMIAIGLSFVNVWVVGLLAGRVLLPFIHRREPWLSIPAALLSSLSVLFLS